MAPKSNDTSSKSKVVDLDKCKLTLKESKGGENSIVAFPNPIPGSKLSYTMEETERDLVVRGNSKSCSYENVRRKRQSERQSSKGKRKRKAGDEPCDSSDDDSGSGSGGVSLSPAGGQGTTTTMTAVYNKETREVTLHYGKDVNMIAPLTQSISKYNPVVKDNALEEHSYAARRDALYESFGSSKKLKVLKSQKANEVKIGNVIGGDGMNDGLEAMEQSRSNMDAMESVKRGREAADVVAESVEISRRALLPKYDPDAKSPRQVYKARDIAGDEVWGMISRMVDGCCHDDGWLEKLAERIQFEVAVKMEFEMMPQGGLEKDDRAKVKSLVLLNHLMKFSKETGGFKFRGKSAEDLSKRARLPEVVCVR